MTDVLLTRSSRTTLPIALVTEKQFPAWLKRQDKETKTWLGAQEFKAKAGRYCLVPARTGETSLIVAGISEIPSLWDIADLPSQIPFGIYHLDWDGPIAFHEWLALGWQLGAYRYTRYKKYEKKCAQLLLPKKADAAKIRSYAASISLARDLINTPCEDLGPAELASEVSKVGKKFGAQVKIIKGDDLLRKNYPAVHAVGRASSRSPRLIDLVWGNPKHPRVTLVGKGVCFDTGGLDIKPSSGMFLMKKDMGGAAAALAVALMVMRAKLPLRLRLLIPAVENSISGNAYRPSDVITMRSGLTVEVGNTDAEGRLILADAIAEAASETPRILIDFSTLTGAARTALGTEISAMFCNDDKIADQLFAYGKKMEDPLWRLPLHAAYGKMLDTYVADINSCGNSPYAGAITAALFLERFVPAGQAWVHLDFMAWNTSTKAGRPEGGEAMSVRAVYQLLESMAR